MASSTWRSTRPATTNLTVAAASNRKPDGKIKVGTGALVGNDVYNLDATGQSKSKTLTPGNKAKFTIQIQHDGTGGNDAFKVLATGANVTGYTVKWKLGTTDITDRRQQRHIPDSQPCARGERRRSNAS